MNRLIPFILLALLISGCSKSSDVKPIVLTGSYTSYKEIDTVYIAFDVNRAIESIEIYSVPYDTLYNYPGSVNANGYYNVTSDNAAAHGQITITFNSSSTATITQTSFVPVYITYNLKAGTYVDGIQDTRERIVAIDDNTVELITNPTSVNNQPNTTGFMIATYYRKQ